MDSESNILTIHAVLKSNLSYDTESNIFGVLFGGLFGAMRDFVKMFI